jgi:hypothetical protein
MVVCKNVREAEEVFLCVLGDLCGHTSSAETLVNRIFMADPKSTLETTEIRVTMGYKLLALFMFARHAFRLIDFAIAAGAGSISASLTGGFSVDCCVKLEAD